MSLIEFLGQVVVVSFLLLVIFTMGGVAIMVACSVWEDVSRWYRRRG